MRAMQTRIELPGNELLPRRSLFARVFTSLMFLFLAGGVAGQDSATNPRVTEVRLRVLSAEIARFDRPVRIGPPGRTIEYREALVLKVAVDRDAFDSLPPDIEPRLYIGRNEYRIFDIDRTGEGRDLVLTFHVRKWDTLDEGAAIVLTIDHEAPIRDRDRYSRQDTPRFHGRMIIDKR